MGAADHSEAGEGDDGAVTQWTEERPVDRSHNRDTLSSEAMTEMLRDIQDAMLALDERLVELESSRDSASEDTRTLAKGVADLGDVLARRVRSLEQGRQIPPPSRAEPMAPPLKPARQPPQNRVGWVVGLVLVLALVLAAFWLLGVESLDHATVTAPPQAAAAAPPPAPAPVAKPPPLAPPHVPPKTTSHTVTAPHRSTSRSTTPRVSIGATPTATNSTTPVTGFGHYGPSPSVTTPTVATPAPAPPHPPS